MFDELNELWKVFHLHCNNKSYENEFVKNMKKSTLKQIHEIRPYLRVGKCWSCFRINMDVWNWNEDSEMSCLLVYMFIFHIVRKPVYNFN